MDKGKLLLFCGNENRVIPIYGGANAPLWLVRNTHASGEDYQTSEDGEMWQEQAYEVVDMGCGNSEQVHGGDL